MSLEPEPFEPAEPASPVFSLREHLLASGVPQANLSSALGMAHNLASTIKGLNLRRFNPRTNPMAGEASG